MSTSRFLTLDGLRGIAAFAVVLGHASRIFPSLTALPLNGMLPVDLFFMMSGFVIAHAYEGRLTKSMSVMKFVRLRIVRVYPLYLLGTILSLLYIYLSNDQNKMSFSGEKIVCQDILLELFMFLAVRSEFLFSLNPAAWSLVYEIMINILFAVTFEHRTQQKLIAWNFLSLPAVIMSLFLFGNGDTGWAWSPCLGGLARVAFDFPLGVLIFRIRQNGQLNFSSPALIPLTAAFVCFFIGPRNGNLGVLLTTLALVGVLPFIVALAVQVEPPGGVRAVFAFLGMLSYPVYVLHVPIMWLSIEAGFVDPAQPTPAELALVATMTVVTALLVHRWYDLPVRGWLSPLDDVRL